VSEQDPESLRKRLVKMNPRAPIKKVHFGRAHRGNPRHPRFHLSAVLELDPEFLRTPSTSTNEHVAFVVFARTAVR